MNLKILIFIFVLLISENLWSQPDQKQHNFSLGIRNTFSLFNHDNQGAAGFGVGGQVRYKISKRLNTEWFADYITNSVQQVANRTDGHVGWSVMYYLNDPQNFTKKITPYIVAGHCFDFTRLNLIAPTNAVSVNNAQRWSSAVQGGIGSHYNITPLVDLSLAVQYMIHFGESIGLEKNADDIFEISRHQHTGIEGHLLCSISANIKL
jgi:hypothetical protein